MRPRRFLAALAASCLLLLAAPAFAAGASLVVGTVGDNVKKQTIRFQALTDYLQPKLGPDGIENVRVAVASSTAAMAEMIRGGQVDLYIDSPLVVTKVAPNSPAAEKQLQAGDVILEVDQKPVTTPQEVTDIVAKLQQAKKRSVLLFVERQGDPRFAALRLTK